MRHTKKPLLQLGLWGTTLLPLVALGLVLKPRYDADQARQRVEQVRKQIATCQEPRVIFSIPHGSVIASMAVGPHNQLAVAYWDTGNDAQERLQRFDLKTAQAVGEPVALEGFPMPGMAFTPEGKRLVLPLSQDGRKTIAFRQAGTGQLLKQVELASQPTPISWDRGGVLSPDASYFVRPEASGTLQLLSITSGKRIKTLQPLKQLPASVFVSIPNDLAVSENGDWIAARLDRAQVHDSRKLDGELTLWWRGGEKALWRIEVCASGGSSLPLTVGKNGDILAFMELPVSSIKGQSIDTLVGCLDATSGRARWWAPASFRDPVTGLAISPDGQLAAIRTLGSIELRRMSDGKIVAQWAYSEGLKKREGGLQGLTFTPDGSQLLDVRSRHILSWSLEGLP